MKFPDMLPAPEAAGNDVTAFEGIVRERTAVKSDEFQPEL
jgi:hypothetical protein